MAKGSGKGKKKDKQYWGDDWTYPPQSWDAQDAPSLQTSSHPPAQPRGLDAKLIPAFDGDMTKWQDYEKRVRLFALLDTGPVHKRAPHALHVAHR